MPARRARTCCVLAMHSHVSKLADCQAGCWTLRGLSCAHDIGPPVDLLRVQLGSVAPPDAHALDVSASHAPRVCQETRVSSERLCLVCRVARAHAAPAACGAWSLKDAVEGVPVPNVARGSASAQVHFQRLQGGSWDDAQFANGAEAMSAVLELVRRHQARQPVPSSRRERCCAPLAAARARAWCTDLLGARRANA